MSFEISISDQLFYNQLILVRKNLKLISGKFKIMSTKQKVAMASQVRALRYYKVFNWDLYIMTTKYKNILVFINKSAAIR